MVVSENPEVIEVRQVLISTDVLDYGEASEDDSIDNDGTASDEKYESGSGEAGERTGVTKSVTEEVEEVQMIAKYSSL